jgi:2-polyprenyl-3-methyl-5-hydroxy-6-metoxy-1,4-benzoquinol methylase
MLKNLHSAKALQTAPNTRGRTIRWNHGYDALVWVLTLGQARALRTESAALAHIQPGARVLDVGCGTGDLTFQAERLAGTTGHVYGIDAAPEMIEIARKKARQSGSHVEFRVEAIEALSFPDHTFDVALSSMMMHHLPDDLKMAGLRELARVLAPGGVLVIVDFTFASRVQRVLTMHAGGHVESYRSLPNMLASLGFTDIETGTLKNSWMGFVCARRTPLEHPTTKNKF